MKMSSGHSITVKEFSDARELFVIPDYQREVVWDRPRGQKLIDSILHGIKLPKFYVAKDEGSTTYEVVDGQQRSTTMLAFLDGQLSLSQATMKEFGLEKGTYRDLPSELKMRIQNFAIEYDEITEATEEEKKDYFQRLQDGKPLATRELLNSIAGGMRDFAQALTKHPFFE